MPTYIPSHLFAAIRAGNIDRAREIISASPVLLSVRNERGSTPLILAAYLGDVAMTKVLVEAGADLNETDQAGTALMGASFKGNTEVVRYLLSAGADKSLKNTMGADALAYSEMSGKPELISLLKQS